MKCSLNAVILWTNKDTEFWINQSQCRVRSYILTQEEMASLEKVKKLYVDD